MSDIFLKINDTELPIPGSWSSSYETIETINTSEAGTDLVSVTRLDKINASATFNVMSDMKEMLKAYSQKLSVTVTISGTKHTCRIRNYKETLVKDSYTLAVTQGIWSVSFDITEI